MMPSEATGVQVIDCCMVSAGLSLALHCHTGDLAVCINAATLAVIDAGIPMKDYVCACTASYIEDSPFVGEVMSHTHTRARTHTHKHTTHTDAHARTHTTHTTCMHACTCTHNTHDQ